MPAWRAYSATAARKSTAMPDHRQSARRALVPQADQQRNLASTRLAPGCPEVEDDRVAGPVREPPRACRKDRRGAGQAPPSEWRAARARRAGRGTCATAASGRRVSAWCEHPMRDHSAQGRQRDDADAGGATPRCVHVLWASEERLPGERVELRRLHIADDAIGALLLPAGAVKSNRRRPEDAEVLEELLVLRVVARHVGAQQHDLAERALHAEDRRRCSAPSPCTTRTSPHRSRAAPRHRARGRARPRHRGRRAT